MLKYKFFLVFILWGFLSATSEAQTRAEQAIPQKPSKPKIVHVIVALCDNISQGIVPVPEHLGNGDDPKKNLYWGAAFGLKTFFDKAQDWQRVSITSNVNEHILERLVYQHKTQNAYLVADAYRGRDIAQGTLDFFQFASGNQDKSLILAPSKTGPTFEAGAKADLIVYVGHNGLMDFALSSYPHHADSRSRPVMIFACASKFYFGNGLKHAGAFPLLWTTGLMAPEAYVLKAAIDGWLARDGSDTLRRRVAQAYHSYQKCGLKGALGLFASGWD